MDDLTSLDTPRCCHWDGGGGVLLSYLSPVLLSPAGLISCLCYIKPADWQHCAGAVALTTGRKEKEGGGGGGGKSPRKQGVSRRPAACRVGFCSPLHSLVLVLLLLLQLEIFLSDNSQLPTRTRPKYYKYFSEQIKTLQIFTSDNTKCFSNHFPSDKTNILQIFVKNMLYCERV